MSTVNIKAAELLPMIEEAEKGLYAEASGLVHKHKRVNNGTRWRSSYEWVRRTPSELQEAVNFFINQPCEPHYSDRATLQGLRVLCTMSDTIELSTEDALVLNRYS